MKKLGKNKLCGCDSGKKYKNCCYNKDFEYNVDEKGNVFRSVKIPKKISNELKSFLEAQNKEFKEIFGREMRGEDPVFFQNKYLEDPHELNNKLVEAMQETNIRPEIIYAFLKTDLLLSEANLDKMPDSDIKKWVDAVKGYRKRVSKGENPFNDFSPPKEVEDLFNELPKAIYVIAQLLSQKDFLGIDKANKKDILLFSSVFFCITKTEKNLKSVLSLIQNIETTTDALNISRSIYEIYLSMHYTINNPGDVEQVFLNLKKGKGGKRKSITKKELADKSQYSEDKAIHKFLYGYLSSYTHPNIITTYDYVDLEAFAPLTIIQIFILSLMYSAFIMHDLLKLGKVEKKFEEDINLYLKRIKNKLLSFFKKYPRWFKNDTNTNLIISRIKRIRRPDI